jgi:hypothetical protein
MERDFIRYATKRYQNKDKSSEFERMKTDISTTMARNSVEVHNLIANGMEVSKSFGTEILVGFLVTLTLMNTKDFDEAQEALNKAKTRMASMETEFNKNNKEVE